MDNSYENTCTPLPAENKRCYSVKEVLGILHISRPTLYKLLQKRVFSWVQLGNGQYRISKKSFDEWLDGTNGR